MRTIAWVSLLLLGGASTVLGAPVRGDRAAARGANALLSAYRKTGQKELVTPDGTKLRLHHYPNGVNFMGLQLAPSPVVTIHTERKDRAGKTKRTFEAASPEARLVQDFMSRTVGTGRAMRRYGDGPTFTATPDATFKSLRGDDSIVVPAQIGELSRGAKGRFTGSKTVLDGQAPSWQRSRVWGGKAIED